MKKFFKLSKQNAVSSTKAKRTKMPGATIALQWAFRTSFLTLLLSILGYACLADSRYSVSTGNWNSTTTWSATSGGAPGASIPVAGDSVTIGGGHIVTVTADAACASISFVTENASNSVQFVTGFSLTVSGNVTIPRAAGGGSNMNAMAVGGGILIVGGNIAFMGAGGSVKHIMTIATGTVMVSGNLTTEGGTSYSGTITFSGAGLLQLSGSIYDNSHGTLTTVPGSTVQYNGAGDQTMGDFTYDNLTLSGSGMKYINDSSGSSPTIVNNTLSMEDVATIYAAPTYGSAARLRYNTAVSRTAGPEWVNPFVSTGGVLITNAGTIDLNANKVLGLNAPLIINTGAALNTSASNYQLTFGGDFMNSGTFVANASPINIANTGTQSISGFTTTGAVGMTKSGGIATFTGDVNASDLVNNGAGGTLNFGAGRTHTFTGAWTSTAGALNGGSSMIRFGGDFAGTGGSFVAGSSTIEWFAPTAQVIAGVTYNNLILSGSGAKTTTGATVNGTLSMRGTATATGATPVYGAAATLEYMGAAAQVMGNEFQSPWVATGGVVVNNTFGVALSSSVQINTLLTLTNGVLSIGDNDLIFGGVAAPVAGASATNYISTVATGQVRKLFFTNGTYTFQIGNAGWTPITLGVSGTSYLDAYVAVNTQNWKFLANANTTNYLARFWNVGMSGIENPSYVVVSANFMPADVAGSESTIVIGAYMGAVPWVKIPGSAVNTTTHTLSASGAIIEANAVITGINAVAPLVDISSVTPICVGFSTGFTATGIGDAAFTYSWSPATGLSAVTGASVTAAPEVTTVYTVIATDGNGFTASNSLMVTVNPLPVAYNVTGGGAYCAGGTGPSIFLAGSDAGVQYQLYMGGLPVGAVVAGSGSAVIFGSFPDAGVYTAVAIDESSLCSNNMLGNAVVIVNPLPDAYTVTGGGSYCAGGIGVHIGLSGSVVGFSYTISNGVSSVTLPGTDNALDFGLLTDPGTYTAIAVNDVTGCQNVMASSAAVSINTLPVVYGVLGGGAFCAGGTGVYIGLSGSNTGINYTLSNGTVSVTTPGSGTALDFGLLTDAGTYNAVALNTATGCVNAMSGAANVIINPLPEVYTLTGEGTYCLGAAPLVGISNSQVGVEYWLFLDGTALGSAVPGTGTSFGFMTPTASGLYSVLATNTTTGCTQPMADAINVTINPLPPVNTMTGGGNYCLGGIGVHVGLGGSNIGIRYQLFRNTLPVGSPYDGIDYPLDFGLQTAGGSYTVVAVDAATSCTSNMVGAAVVGVDTLYTPVVSINVPAGELFPGQYDTLVAVVSNAGPGATYQWLVNATYIAGATSAYYISNTFANHDSVTCLVTSHSPCGSITTGHSTIISVNNVGIGELNANAGIMLAPNPSNGTFTLSGSLRSGLDQAITITVTDVAGQNVYAITTAASGGQFNKTVNLSENVANGLYLLTLRSGDEKHIFRLSLQR